ncbi:MAG TPA: hypothetical protein VMY76_00825 [Gemmatimonadales bacterium]|nr:hypothetical protein [Gemmatimonadales bacterium]
MTNPDAAANPTAGGVPAARPEGEPGAAAVSVPPDSPTWPYVFRFALLMEAKLDKNRHKGNREGWINDSPGALFKRLMEEAAELKFELFSGNDSARVANEAADVANFAMMIAGVCGGLVPVAKHTHPAPRGLAAEMREFVANRVHESCADLPRSARCLLTGKLAPFAMEITGCNRARSILVDATPAAVAALDRQARETLNGAVTDRVPSGANEWVDLGVADGLTQAADLATEAGQPALAERIRALIPADVSVHTCSHSGDVP